MMTLTDHQRKLLMIVRDCGPMDSARVFDKMWPNKAGYMANGNKAMYASAHLARLYDRGVLTFEVKENAHGFRWREWTITNHGRRTLDAANAEVFGRD